MKKAIGPAIFKWRQTEPELILCAVRWTLRDSLSLRDVEELLNERGLEADHTRQSGAGSSARSFPPHTRGCNAYLSSWSLLQLDSDGSWRTIKTAMAVT